MEIAERTDGTVLVFTLNGRLDLASATMLKERVKNHLAKGKTQIHLTCSAMDFINSSGLGGLVSIMKEIRMVKGHLTLSNLAAYVQGIFDLTQLTHIFEIFPTEEAALVAQQQPR